jgi:hypothetical protein
MTILGQTSQFLSAMQRIGRIKLVKYGSKSAFFDQNVRDLNSYFFSIFIKKYKEKATQKINLCGFFCTKRLLLHLVRCQTSGYITTIHTSNILYRNLFWAFGFTCFYITARAKTLGIHLFYHTEYSLMMLHCTLRQ